MKRKNYIKKIRRKLSTNKRKSMKRKYTKRKSIKRKSIKRKSMKRKSMKRRQRMVGGDIWKGYKLDGSSKEIYCEHELPAAGGRPIVSTCKDKKSFETHHPFVSQIPTTIETITRERARELGIQNAFSLGTPPSGGTSGKPKQPTFGHYPGPYTPPRK